ncbi:MAG TPA: signal peptidase II [Chlamydiales bacterium]|nr:signal peptidase II [Chlamydiales bacterium]
MRWFLPFLLFLDIVSKMIALHWIPPLSWGGYPFGGIPMFNFLGISFSLNTIFNTGAAWGIFSGNPGLLFASRVLILTVLGVYLYFFQRAFLQRASLWLVAIGALGNAIDYLLYGHVVDFLHFVFWGYSFPIFNLADSYITLGVIALLLIPRPKSLPVV